MKKILLLLSAALLFAVFFVACTSVSDMKDDKDIQAAEKYAVVPLGNYQVENPADCNMILGDVDGDGEVTNADVLMIYRYIYNPGLFPLPTFCDHSYGDWNVEKMVTCTEDGVLTRACTKCSKIEETIIDSSNAHVEVTSYGWEATCTRDGVTNGKFCSACRIVLVEQEPIPAIGHSMVKEYYEEAATCTWYGYVSEEKCINCGVRPVLSQSAPLGHSLDENGTCSTCGTGVGDYWLRALEDRDMDGSGMSLNNFDQVCIYDEYPDVILPLEYYCGYKIKPELIDNTLMGCDWVVSITIPEYYTVIGCDFASGCDNLRYVYIPSTVTYIDEYAFVNSYNLEVIHYGGTVEEWKDYTCWLTGSFRVDNDNCKIYCSDGVIELR